MQTLNISGYKFLPLCELKLIQQQLKERTASFGLRGTILLSSEGININLAGESSAVEAWLSQLYAEADFADISFHRSYSDKIPFRYLKVKIKKEIITFRQPSIDLSKKRAPAISAIELKQWLDEKQSFTLLDTRNEYEITYGGFRDALHLDLQDFSELPRKLTALDKKAPVVMFCTGGVRCEKAAIYMMQAGFEHVYQLDRGILGYFAQVGGAHYEGGCFVFDDRVALDAHLQPMSS